MRQRSHRRNLVVWSQSAGSVGRYGAPPFTRRRRIRRWIRTGALLTVVRLMPPARAVRACWRPLLAGGVLTVAGVMWLDGPGGMVLLPGLWLLLTAPLNPASPKADRMRRPEVEDELAVFSTPAQRRIEPGFGTNGPEVARHVVPVACPIARSETVCSGHSRTRQIGSELQILWSAMHDKPVPKLIVACGSGRYCADARTM
jgi:hypothetical protein